MRIGGCKSSFSLYTGILNIRQSWLFFGFGSGFLSLVFMLIGGYNERNLGELHRNICICIVWDFVSVDLDRFTFTRSFNFLIHVSTFLLSLASCASRSLHASRDMLHAVHVSSRRCISSLGTQLSGLPMSFVFTFSTYYHVCGFLSAQKTTH